LEEGFLDGFFEGSFWLPRWLIRRFLAGLEIRFLGCFFWLVARLGRRSFFGLR
jgi:hypothetical protein